MLTNSNSGSFKNMPFDQKIFNIIMSLNLFNLILDTGMWVSDGKTQNFMIVINYVSTFIYYMLTPLICLFCLIYTDYRINENKSALFKRLRFYLIPAVICTIMTVFSPFTGWFFNINSANRYERGSLFYIAAGIAFLYLVSCCGMAIYDIIKNGWKENKIVDFPLMVFFVALIIAAAIQTRYYGVSLIWVTASLVCAHNYINIQNVEISTDYLTGLYNRRRLDRYLQRRIATKRGNRLLFMIVLDIDDFKKINDIYGHAAGDEALIKTAELLRKTKKQNDDFIARMGGDEFAIVGHRNEKSEIAKLTEKINVDFKDYNNQGALRYKLTLSMGYSIFKEGDNEDTLMASADKDMYKNKSKQKEFSEPLITPVINK
jgi:diguanylate cyclase (GGDEF)-like protein